MQFANREHEEDGEREAREEVRGPRAARLRAEVRVVEDEAETLLQVGPQTDLAPVDRRHLRGFFDLADAQHEKARTDEAQSVGEDRPRRCQDLDERSAEPRSRYLRCGAADLELRVALDDLLALDERRQVRLVRDVEEDLEHADQEPDDEKLGEREDIGDVRERDRQQEQRASEVADDEDRPSGKSVDPHPGGEREDDEGKEFDRPQHRDLEGARVQHQDRHQRQGQLTRLRAELADRLRRPQLQEVAVAPEPAVRPEATHREARSRSRPWRGDAASHRAHR